MRSLPIRNRHPSSSSGLTGGSLDDSHQPMFYVYIMTNRTYGTLYVGVTNDIARRAWEHREGLAEGFTKRYGLKLLVHVEQFQSNSDAIHREKRG